MSGSTAWRSVKYGEVFEEELRGLNRRRAYDPKLKREDVEKLLKNLYIMDGADWGGRGELQDIVMAATIAAHEQFIDEWKKEQNDGMESQPHID